jgi:hypothetical protein
VSDSRKFLDYSNIGEPRRDHFLLRQLVLCAIITLMVAAVVVVFGWFHGLI